MIDVNLIRDPEIRMNGLEGADKAYRLYYDETNNIRRLHVTPDGLNVKDPKCFVLGGIGHHGSARDLDFASLRSSLRLQKSTNEMKLEHLGRGDFLQLLQSAKVETFLRWIIEANLFVHFQALDAIYWSIVDIVDSIITEEGSVELIMAAPLLKDDLYTVLRDDLDGLVDIFQRYTYPNVRSDKRRFFVRELRDLAEARRGLLAPFNFQILKGVLEMAAKLESLPFLEDETSNVLIDEFSAFYIKRICLFKNSTHVLDIEETIAARLNAETFLDGARPMRNYRFVDSKQEPGVQIAEAIAGLLGKCFTFVNQTPLVELHEARSRFSAMQTRNLAHMADILDRSIAENAAFASYVLSHEDRRRCAFLLES
jgi:hypothetical protein